MEPELREEQGVRLAVEGCGHGTLHAIYASVEEACKQKSWPGVDLLIIGGDFQSVRNAYDLNCVSMPAKYRSMCDFHEYYSGQRTAPCLTIFVGGNHEASNYLFELYYGGWVAPNIYYMGAANVLRLGPLRIAGMSGIWKGYNFRKPHFERLPYNESDMRSVYHTRELDIRKLLQVRTQVDVGISHDWPKGVEWKGNWKLLFRYKKHLEEDAKGGQLGSVAAQQVMDRLRPRYWFSAHLHCKYAAVVEHGDKAAQQHPLPTADINGTGARNGNEADSDENIAGHHSANLAIEKNDDEIDLDMDDDTAETTGAPIGQTANADEIDLELEDDTNGVAPVAPGQGMDNVAVPVTSDAPINVPILSTDAARAELPEAFRRPAAPGPKNEPAEHPPDIDNKTTHFLALDKCLPNKDFLQLMPIPVREDIEPRRPLKLEYDREWLAITRAFVLSEPCAVGDPDARVPPAKSQAEYQTLVEDQAKWLAEHLSDSDVIVPNNFEVTAPTYDGGNWNLPQYSTVQEYPNAQTARFCEILQIPNALAISADELAARMEAGPRADPDAERFAAQKRGRGGFGHGGGRGGGRGRSRGGGRGRSRGR
ncbi:hypothetical protein LTR36_003750 [Oleoguttula mirabilis]|uniref:Lariat debranching enzyme C-terminal domain-containing protein n=1 Tax=Oleoguttula mirabilis TaxID=1507867 RepID=A0AAV9JHW0_9PEZI|nr:hypothetical protein LTR36_003750 [Oleoguttula mirabilis]